MNFPLGVEEAGGVEQIAIAAGGVGILWAAVPIEEPAYLGLDECARDANGGAAIGLGDVVIATIHNLDTEVMLVNTWMGNASKDP